ncbi:MAG: TonB-dependent receptor [Acidobacteriota bacterium]
MIKLNYGKKIPILAVAILTLLILPAQVFSQSASLSGTVQDTSEGYLPGVTITAVNVETGVETVTLANDSGAFSFPSLQPGTYEVSAELDGFQKSTKTNVSLGGNAQMRMNFELEVAGLSEEIEVTTTAQDILTESSSSTGTVLRSQSLIELPLTSNDVMELVNIMGGVQPGTGDLNNPWSTEYDSQQTDQSFAGVDSNAIHIQQDGITINDVRYNTGIASSSRINTEMVSEFKLVLSPVDAEMGRGMGQVQILTKSGANAYHGSGVWNITNSALDANSWSNNRVGIPLDWRNLNTYNLSFSGPIKKNKTFFFLTWDHAIPRTREVRHVQVLTDCARLGIFRYFPGVGTGHYDIDKTTTAWGTQVQANVDYNGFPLDSDLAAANNYTFEGLDVGDIDPVTKVPLGTGHIVQPLNEDHPDIPNSVNYGNLQYTSAFGPLTQEASDLLADDILDCSDYGDQYYTPAWQQGLYNMDQPDSPSSLAALGIERYWEARDDGTGTVYRIMDTQAIPEFTEVMPRATTFRFTPTSQGQAGADGLNFATHTWTRVNKGVDRIYGVGQENNRKNITVKIDHNFNDRHRASGTYTYERDVNAGAQKLWPNGYEGTTERFPTRFSISVTSSLRPTLLNEARFGLNRNKSHSLNAIDATATQGEVAALMQKMLPTDEWQNYLPGEPFYFNPQRFWTNNYNSHFIGGAEQPGFQHSFLPSWGGYDHRWTMSDTLTWTKGRHSLKFGGEIRLTRSHQDADGDVGGLLTVSSLPVAFGGIAEYSLPTDLGPQVPGLSGGGFFWAFAGTYLNLYDGALRQMQDLRDYMGGSMSHVWQWYFIEDPFDKDWNDIYNGEIEKISDIRAKEMAFFAKDDWKVTNSLTLNLGLRYEYYGVPYMDGGMSLALEGGPQALFGVSGRDFNGWMAEFPVNLGPDYYTTQEFVGPGSPQSDISVYDKDLNNFGPAVGFAWQLPWFGKGKTTLRGGYQLSYSQIANADNISGGFADILEGSTGTNFNYYFYGGNTGCGDFLPYLRFANLDDYLPTNRFLACEDPPILPLETLHIINRGGTPPPTLSVYDYEVSNPYAQSLNLSISRNIGSNVTFDVRYIGTLARRGMGSLDLNSNNFLKNGNSFGTLFDGLTAARAGGTSEILDALFMGVQFENDNILNEDGTNNLIAVGDPGGPTGGDVIRALYVNDLVSGNFNSIAGSLSNLNYTRRQEAENCNPWTGVCTITPGLNDGDGFWDPGTLESGTMLRHANLYWEDLGYLGQFPENFIDANPQVGTANWYTNLNHNNYHSLQLRFEVRPTRDYNITSTYTWAKNLGNSSYTNPNDRTNPFDYTWTGNSRAHQLTSYGAWTLPFGANGFFFRDISNPVARRFIEGWNLSWILTMGSGSRSNISADATHLYGNSVLDIVRPELFDTTAGHVQWDPGARYGYYWGDPGTFAEGPDLQCYDSSIVSYAYHWETDPDGVMQRVEDRDVSLRDDCLSQISALYTPMPYMFEGWEYDYDDTDPESDWLWVEEERFEYSPASVIMQHPMPGEYGSFGRNRVEGIGSFSLDMAIGKTVQLTEGKSVQFRVDASNILNHPSPSGGGGGTINNDGTELGRIGNKGGSRRFQAKLTIRF